MKTLSVTALLCGILVGTAAHARSASVTVFNSKEGSDISALFKEFQERTGIQVNVTSGPQAELLKRLKAGERADVFIVNDVINFSTLTKEGLFQPVTSTAIESAVPARFRESKKRWFGLSYKARTIMYDRYSVDPEELSTYEDLAQPKWKGKLCLRNSSKTYNRALVASLIVHHGVEGAKRIIAGWVANLAAPVFEGDQKLLDAIAAGTCKVGIANTYYLGRILSKNPAFAVEPFWANQDDRGLHANVAGMALLKDGRNGESGVMLMEFLAEDGSQRRFADSNFEFPVSPRVRPGSLIRDWEAFVTDATPVELYGDLADFAAELSLSTGYR